MKGKGCTVKGYVCDVTIRSDVKAAFKRIEEDFGPITVLVNNAGAFRFISLDGNIFYKFIIREGA